MLQGSRPPSSPIASLSPPTPLWDGHLDPPTPAWDVHLDPPPPPCGLWAGKDAIQDQLEMKSTAGDGFIMLPTRTITRPY